ncbi:MAG: hypothetical protein QM776_16995 [Rhodocyclaceae bacterium]
MIAIAITASLSAMYLVVWLALDDYVALVFGSAWLLQSGLLGWSFLRMPPLRRVVAALLLVTICGFLLPRHKCGSETAPTVTASC